MTDTVAKPGNCVGGGKIIFVQKVKGGYEFASSRQGARVGNQ